MLRMVLLSVSLTLLASAAPVFAQEWSDDEQEVLDNLAECWDIWMEGVESGSPERWISECSTPTMTYWFAPDGAPGTNDVNRRTWETISRTDLGWVDIRPVSLTITDDIAVLHFYGYWRAATADGETITEMKRTEVFKQLDGRWKLMAGHSTPVTADDAAPYR